MKVVILYHPQSEQRRPVEDFARDFTREHPDGKIDLLSLETQAGAEMARLYDVTNYPAVMALRDSGELMRCWQDGILPLMNEVAFYATQ